MKRLAFEREIMKVADMEQEIGKNATLVFTKVHVPFGKLLDLVSCSSWHLDAYYTYEC